MTATPHTGALASSMLIALLISLIGRLRRRLKSVGSAMSLIADAFAEMQDMRRIAQRKFPHLEL